MNEHDFFRNAMKFVGGAIIASLIMIAIMAIPGTYVIWQIAGAAFTNGNVLEVMKQPLMLFCEILLLIGIFFSGISLRFVLFIGLVTAIRYLTL